MSLAAGLLDFAANELKPVRGNYLYTVLVFTAVRTISVFVHGVDQDRSFQTHVCDPVGDDPFYLFFFSGVVIL